MQLRLIATIIVALFSVAGPLGAQPVETPPAAATPVPSATPTATPGPAGVIPSALTLDVTGVPVADGVFLDSQIRHALDRAIRPTLRPGASISYGPIAPWPLFALPANGRAAVNVTVTISGDSANASIAVSAVTQVVLNGVTAPAVAPAVLYLSDDPEYVQSEGLIYRGPVTAARPARLYYYHSDIGVPRDLDVVLTSSIPARVHIIASEAGPELDVMNVGHVVTRDVLRYERANEGAVATILPGKPYVVRHALMLQGEVVAGAVDLSVLDGGTVTANVIASPAGSPPDAYLAGPRVPYDGHRRHGAFDLASYGAHAATFTVGGPPVSVQYGTRATSPRNLDPNDDGHDYGDYGVVQRITLTLVNPGDDPRPVYLYERPVGGPVRSTFIVDGNFRELGCVRLQQPYWLTTYQLAPHTTGVSTTVTMTDGGSFYPLEFGATDVPPLPYTPPVGSADGCSPNVAPFSEPAATSAR